MKPDRYSPLAAFALMIALAAASWVGLLLLFSSRGPM